jgi:hypothetical protein
MDADPLLACLPGGRCEPNKFPVIFAWTAYVHGRCWAVLRVLRVGLGGVYLHPQWLWWLLYELSKAIVVLR